MDHYNDNKLAFEEVDVVLYIVRNDFKELLIGLKRVDSFQRNAVSIEKKGVYRVLRCGFSETCPLVYPNAFKKKHCTLETKVVF